MGTAVLAAHELVDDTKRCRQRTKAMLKRFNRPRDVSDLATFAWFAAKCGHCAQCPKLMAKYDITPRPRPLAVVESLPAR